MLDNLFSNLEEKNTMNTVTVSVICYQKSIKHNYKQHKTNTLLANSVFTISLV